MTQDKTRNWNLRKAFQHKWLWIMRILTFLGRRRMQSRAEARATCRKMFRAVA